MPFLTIRFDRHLRLCKLHGHSGGKDSDAIEEIAKAQIFVFVDRPQLAECNDSPDDSMFDASSGQRL